MASFFIDMDGTFFKSFQNVPNEGAVESVQKLKSQGHQIYFTTKREYSDIYGEDLNLYETIKVLENLNVKYNAIIDSVESPRVIINDQGSFAVNHVSDSPLIINPLDFKYEE